jgi:putative membrane protein
MVGELLSEAERARIIAAIRAAEGRTRAEFVTVIARRSARYGFVVLLWAPTIAFLVAAGLYASGVMTAFVPLLQAQLAAFAGVLVLSSWRPMLRLMVPRRLLERAAARLAREQFHALGLHETADRGGVLLFVSEAERYVEIIADRGINEKVSAGTWERIVAEFTAKVRAGRAGDGFVAAVEASGALMAQHFPRRADDRNELPDVLIEL